MWLIENSVCVGLQKNGGQRGCSYFEWHDLPMSQRAKDLILDLKDDRDYLLEENRSLRSLKMDTVNVDNDVAELWLELRKLNKAHGNEHLKLHATRKKNENSICYCTFSVIILICILCSS